MICSFLAPPSSIAGGNTYTLGISLSGTANGETITVNPASNACDASGNVASTSKAIICNIKYYQLRIRFKRVNEAAYVNDDPAFESTDLSIQVWVDPVSLLVLQAWFVIKMKYIELV